MLKKATTLTYIQQIRYSAKEFTDLVDKWMWNIWQREWTMKRTCKYQDIFQPERGEHNINNVTRQESIINRMRLLQQD